MFLDKAIQCRVDMLNIVRPICKLAVTLKKTPIMEKKYINGQQLTDFVETHDLRNSYSNIHFNAIISITTAKNRLVNQQMEVMISFENYNSLGLVTLLENDIDPLIFPTSFEATWQKMEHIENEYLLISDIHRKNPKIGKYSVKIIPLKNIRD